ncbi:MAG: 2,3-bisphosphoglycerate-dependent phosphoglycerate mutase [Anaplasmataceae bacterium]|nr:2,3-bisphosphoglycerate-dependent phosphoglycerate mutase [Anaplasmataceae bacterium]
MSHLALVRHGKSSWNHLGLWTGLTDVDLVEEGRVEARQTAELLRSYHFHQAFTSELKRTHQTLEEILKTLERTVSWEIDAALNERHYGIHTGKNKWEIKDSIGEEAFQAIRRGWDVPIEGGETLKDVYNRIVPFYQNRVIPFCKTQSNILVVAHGNSLRALIKHLESVNDEDIANVEIGTGEAVIYNLSKEGEVISKELRGSI